MILDLLAAAVIGATFLAVSFAVYLRAADKGLEK